MARTCSATTKKGTRCTRPPLAEHTVCIAHAPENVKDSRGFGRAQPGSGRPRTPTAIEVLRERIESDVDVILDPLWQALQAEAPVVVGQGKDAFVEMHPDHRTQIAAARELLDRGYGKARQAMDITSDGAAAVVLVAPADSLEKSRKAAELLQGVGAVDASR